MWDIERNNGEGSSQTFVYFQAGYIGCAQYSTTCATFRRIMWCVSHDSDEYDGGCRRVACFVCAFLLSRVCPAARRDRGRLMQMKRTMCLNSLTVFIYAIRFIIFRGNCLFLPRRCSARRNTHAFYRRNKPRTGRIDRTGQSLSVPRPWHSWLVRK